MFTGLFVEPVAVMVRLALYTPAMRPAIFTDKVTVPLSEPLSGLRLSHVASSLTDQFNVPPPVFVILKV